MAVRLALGETHLVKENKDYFEQEGVDLNALESSKAKGGGKVAEERSNTVILVKNLPYTTAAADLAKRFGAFGDVSGRPLCTSPTLFALLFSSTECVHAFFHVCSAICTLGNRILLRSVSQRDWGSTWPRPGGPSATLITDNNLGLRVADSIPDIYNVFEQSLVPLVEGVRVRVGN